MEPTRYRIVFRGEVGLGYDHNEIRQNLVQLTRWEEKKIDQLLSSSHCIIKSDLDSAAAERMLNARESRCSRAGKYALPHAHFKLMH